MPLLLQEGLLPFMNTISLPPTWLFGATSIVGFNLANLFPNTIYPFRSPGKSFSKVRGWPALQLDDPQWIHNLFRCNQPETLIYGLPNLGYCRTSQYSAINFRVCVSVSQFAPARTVI